MKRFLLFFIFLFPLFSSAQNDWAPVGAKWHYTLQLWGGGTSFSEINSILDTVIDGINCRKLVGESISCSIMDAIGTYVYSDGSKVYYYNEHFSSFFLMYDFSLNPGQSWTMFFQGFDSNLDSLVLTVIDTSSISINGFTYKTQLATKTMNDYLFGEGYWIIDRIGWSYFLFPLIAFCDPGTGPLRCYQDSIIGLYDTGEAPYCDYTNVGINEPQLSSLEIYPNPVQDFLYLKNATEELNYKIIDNTGRTILSGKTDKNINIQLLSPGFYHLDIENKVNRTFVKL